MKLKILFLFVVFLYSPKKSQLTLCNQALELSRYQDVSRNSASSFIRKNLHDGLYYDNDGQIVSSGYVSVGCFVFFGSSLIKLYSDSLIKITAGIPQDSVPDYTTKTIDVQRKNFFVLYQIVHFTEKVFLGKNCEIRGGYFVESNSDVKVTGFVVQGDFLSFKKGDKEYFINQGSNPTIQYFNNGVIARNITNNIMGGKSLTLKKVRYLYYFPKANASDLYVDEHPERSYMLPIANASGLYVDEDGKIIKFCRVMEGEFLVLPNGTFYTLKTSNMFSIRDGKSEMNYLFPLSFPDDEEGLKVNTNSDDISTHPSINSIEQSVLVIYTHGGQVLKKDMMAPRKNAQGLFLDRDGMLIREGIVSYGYLKENGEVVKDGFRYIHYGRLYPDFIDQDISKSDFIVRTNNKGSKGQEQLVFVRYMDGYLNEKGLYVNENGEVIQASDRKCIGTTRMIPIRNEDGLYVDKNGKLIEQGILIFGTFSTDDEGRKIFNKDPNIWSAQFIYNGELYDNMTKSRNDLNLLDIRQAQKDFSVIELNSALFSPQNNYLRYSIVDGKIYDDDKLVEDGVYVTGRFLQIRKGPFYKIAPIHIGEKYEVKNGLLVFSE